MKMNVLEARHRLHAVGIKLFGSAVWALVIGHGYWAPADS